MVDDVPLAQILEEYERQCALSNEIIATHSLDDVGKHPDFGSAAATLRWMLIHMVEETAGTSDISTPSANCSTARRATTDGRVRPLVVKSVSSSGVMPPARAGVGVRGWPGAGGRR
jgi:hypothetical protein